MALQASDIIELDTFKQSTPDTDSYTTTVSVAYVEDSEYLLCVVGEDVSLGFPENALGTPTTVGVTWTIIDGGEIAFGRIGMRCYRGICTTTGTVTTDLDFPITQKNCNAGIAKITNTGVISGVTTSTDINTKAGTVTISPSIGAGSAAVAFFGSESSGIWTADTGDTAFLDIVNRVSIFGAYNLNRDETVSVSYTDTDDSEYMLAIGFELPYLAATTPVITTVNGVGGTIADGETNVPIVGTVFNAAIDNTVAISPTSTFSDPTATYTYITGDTAELITVPTIDLPAGASELVYVFVFNGIEISASFPISITTSTASLHTLHIVDDNPATVNVSAGLTTGAFYEILDPGDTNWVAIGAADDLAGTRFDATGAGSGTGTAYALTDVICSTVLGFETGFSAVVFRAATPTTAEYATSITSLSNLDTATIQLMITYPNGAPVAGDVISVTYSATAGDIISVTGNVALPTTTLTTTETEVC